MMALMLATLSAPCAVVAFTMGCWRIAADLRWTSNFVIVSGLFSHWQAWLGSAALLFVTIPLLDRYGQGGPPRTSE
jgi:hypothetical protein